MSEMIRKIKNAVQIHRHTGKDLVRGESKIFGEIRVYWWCRLIWVNENSLLSKEPRLQASLHHTWRWNYLLFQLLLQDRQDLASGGTQSTCGLGAGPLFHDLNVTRIVPLRSELMLLQPGGLPSLHWRMGGPWTQLPEVLRWELPRKKCSWWREWTRLLQDWKTPFVSLVQCESCS